MAHSLDKIDLEILSILMHDAKKPYAEIAKKVHLSLGTIHFRIKKLEKNGILKGSGALVDHEVLGYDITAFLGIYLDKSSLYDRVSTAMKAIPEIVSAHYTTGQYSIFCKIICRDTNHLRTVLYDKLQKIPGIQRTETFISLEESIDRPLNLDGLE